MNRLLVSAATAAFLLVPASGALAADGTAPLKVKGKPSSASQLAFPLPDGWRNDVQPALNRGVYGKDIQVGAATCRVMIVTRGETSTSGVRRSGNTVKLRFNGAMTNFKAVQRGDGWYRSSTTVDPTVAPPGWMATGAGELDVAEDPIVVLAQAHAVVVGDATDAERAQCAAAARTEIARGLRTILDGVAIAPR
jgi:hypothetical protein